MKLAVILGMRPKIIKMSQIIKEGEKRGIDYFILHIGYHFFLNMDRIFFEELELPQLEHDLEVGSGNHAQQTEEIMAGIEAVLDAERSGVGGNLRVKPIQSSLRPWLHLGNGQSYTVFHIPANTR